MKQRKDLSTAEKHQLVQFLSEGSTNGKLARGRRAAVLKFSSSCRTVTRVWAEARKQLEAGQQLQLKYGKMNTRAKRVHIDLDFISSLEMGQRSTIRRLAHRVSCSKSTVGRWIKGGLIKAHTNAIKPDLTAPNKLLRLRFSLEALEVDRIMKDNDVLFREAASTDGFNFTLIQQPPNSPDTNVNDLGFFRSIECLQHKTQCVTVDQLVGAVINSFHNLDHTTLNNVFLSLQGCMVQIMAVRGDNNYKLPHMGKEALIRAGRLPLNLEVPAELVRQCLTYLQESGDTDAVEHIRTTLAIEMDEEEEAGTE